MTSDRKGTVGYAIDLLRAHQIRRENAFLHGELQTSRKEMAALRNEIKDVRATVESCNVTSAKACSLSELHSIQVEEQVQGMEILQQIYNTLKKDLSDFKSACTQTGKKDQAQIAVLENDLTALRSECQDAVAALQQQDEIINASIDKLHNLVDQKAEKSLVEVLACRERGLVLADPAVGPTKDSVSYVPDTFEEKSSHDTPGSE